jgi:two-component system phosphate regulon sensor histidine kinase PhoR
VRQSASTGIYTIYYAEKLPDGRVLRVAYPGSFYAEQESSLMDQAITGLLILVALVALFAIAMSRRESNMLRSLSRAVKEAQEGGSDLPGFDNADLDEALFALSSANRELKSLNEEKLALSQRLEYILANINEGVLLLMDGELVYHNRRAEEILDFKIPKNILDINNQEMINVFASLSGGQSGPLQLGDKSIIVSQALAGGVSRLILLHDVSDQEKYSGYKSDLIGNISHELKTPLALIMGASEVIVKDADMPRSYLDKFLGTIHKNSGRINALLDDLIFLHRLESTRENNVQKCELGETVEELGGLLGQLEKELRYDFEEATVKINSTHLISVLSNLIINANKYSQGEVIEVAIQKNGHLLEIRVSDQGPPIPQAERDRIFERFYTVSKSRNRGVAGSGLGLSIVKHIARVYKGEASLEANQSGGNTFVVRLLEK